MMNGVKATKIKIENKIENEQKIECIQKYIENWWEIES